MHIDASTVWVAALTLLIGPLAYFLRGSLERLRTLETCLFKTREELAKHYATKTDLHADVGRVLERLDKMDRKMDQIIMNAARLKDDH